jgi:hypothetical protein
MTKIKGNMVWGIVITAVFAGLLALRLGYFEETPPPQPAAQKPGIARPHETWMNIYQNKQKIGRIHRTFIRLDDGRYQTGENVIMRINTLGIPQSLHMATETQLNPDMSFSSFNFELNSSLFRFVARGYAGSDQLIVFSGLPHAQTKTVLPIKDLPHISGNVYEAAFLGGLEKEKTREFSIFDPATLGIRKIAVTRSADEMIPIMGKRVLTQKLCADFMGAKHCAWLDKDGDILKETGLLGLSMEKVSPEKAKEGISTSQSADFAQIASIPSNSTIAEPSKLTRIEIKIDGINNVSMLSGGRQNVEKSLLTITKERIPQKPAETIPVFLQAYLKPSPFVQSDHEQIQAQVKKITSPGDSPQERIRKIVGWVYKNIAKKPVLSVPNAVEVLNNKIGDCNEHAVLTAALLRAAGIPAQIEAGLVYLNGRFYYHAWNTAYLGDWVTVDSVFNQIPADVTHLRLVRGEGGEQLDLLGIMGKIKLEVISTSDD